MSKIIGSGSFNGIPLFNRKHAIFDPKSFELSGKKYDITLKPKHHFGCDEPSGVSYTLDSGSVAKYDSSAVTYAETNITKGNAGIIGNCYTLASGYLQLSGGDTFNILDSSFTIAGWINLDSTSFGIFSADSSGGNAFDVYYDTGVFKIDKYISGPTLVEYDSTVAGGISSSTWTHILVTYEKDTSDSLVSIYINGNLHGKTTMGGAFSNTTLSSIRIGSAGSIDSSGKIDDFRIYDRVLIPSEITEVYQMANDAGYIHVGKGNGIIDQKQLTLDAQVIDINNTVSAASTGYVKPVHIILDKDGVVSTNTGSESALINQLYDDVRNPINNFQSLTDGDLTDPNPGPAYQTISQLRLMGGSGGYLYHGLRISWNISATVVANAWSIATPSVGDSGIYTGVSQAAGPGELGSNNICVISPGDPGPGVYFNSFASSGSDGPFTFYFTKSGNGSIDGGFIRYFYDSVAYTYALNNEDGYLIVVTPNYDTYKMHYTEIRTANPILSPSKLITTLNGDIGPAGGGTFLRQQEEIFNLNHPTIDPSKLDLGYVVRTENTDSFNKSFNLDKKSTIVDTRSLYYINRENDESYFETTTEVEKTTEKGSAFGRYLIGSGSVIKTSEVNFILGANLIETLLERSYRDWIIYDSSSDNSLRGILKWIDGDSIVIENMISDGADFASIINNTNNIVTPSIIKNASAINLKDTNDTFSISGMERITNKTGSISFWAFVDFSGSDGIRAQIDGVNGDETTFQVVIEKSSGTKQVTFTRTSSVSGTGTVTRSINTNDVGWNFIELGWDFSSGTNLRLNVNNIGEETSTSVTNWGNDGHTTLIFKGQTQGGIWITNIKMHDYYKTDYTTDLALKYCDESVVRQVVNLYKDNNDIYSRTGNISSYINIEE